MQRYARQTMLPEIGPGGQEKLTRSRVLLVGVGGLGSTIAQLLCAAGTGQLVIADADKVSESNLQRQILYRTSQIGLPKTECAKKSLEDLNPDCRIIASGQWFSPQNALALAQGCHLIVDGSDNARTRYLMNDVAVGLGIPYVYGSIQDFSGQVAVFNASETSPTYRCLFPEPEPMPEPETRGVIGPLPAFIASIQANECIKLLSGAGKPLDLRLFTCNLLTMETACFQIPATDSGRKISLENFRKLPRS